MFESSVNFDKSLTLGSGKSLNSVFESSVNFDKSLTLKLVVLAHY